MKSVYDNMSDNEIIKLIHTGTEDSVHAMEYFLDKYKGLVRQRARTMYLVGGDRDDLIQEGMIGLYKAVREFDTEKEVPFEAFATRVVYQQMCNAINASNRKKNGPLNEYISIYQDDSRVSIIDRIETDISSNPEDFIIDKENADMLEFELEKCLSALEKKVYEMYYQGADYRSIAAELGKTPKAIDNALQRIRSKVSKLLDRHDI